MKNLIVFVVSIFVVGWGNVLSAQQRDYVVTLKGDTIYGKLSAVKGTKLKIKVGDKKESFASKNVYRAFDATKKRLYAPSYLQVAMQRIADTDPKMYRIDEKKQKRKDPVFTEIVTDGDIIVYYFLEQTYNAPMMTAGGGMQIGGYTNSRNNYYALKKSTGQIIEIRKSGFFIFGRMSKKNIGANVLNFIGDAPELVDRLQEEEKLNYDVFLKYIKEYNAIKNAEQASAKFSMQIF